MMDAAKRLAAVLRRCNAVLSGGLGGVDAMGDKVSQESMSCTFELALIAPAAQMLVSCSVCWRPTYCATGGDILCCT